jgi:hypothetical protein
MDAVNASVTSDTAHDSRGPRPATVRAEASANGLMPGLPTTLTVASPVARIDRSSRPMRAVPYSDGSSEDHTEYRARGHRLAAWRQCLRQARHALGRSDLDRS